MNSSGFRKDFKIGKAYWRSLNELSDSPEFLKYLENEFPGGIGDPKDRTTRREFIRLMSSSLALAGIALAELGLTSCRWPKEKIIPFSRQPEERMPGVPVQYATSMEIAGVGYGLLVTSYDGRPIKIDGNPSHPFSLGAASAMMQASLLDLYDPDRSKGIVHREKHWVLNKSWTDFHNFAMSHFFELKKRGGDGLYILSEDTSSVSFEFMRSRLLNSFPNSRFYTYEPVSRDNEWLGTKLGTGKAYRSHLKLDKAKVVLSFDADFLMAHPASLRYSRHFTKGRRAEGFEMNRLYVLEPSYSITGAMADYRYAMPVRDICSFALVLADELASLGISFPGDIRSLLSNFADGARMSLNNQVVKQIASDLIESKGNCVIVAGFNLPPEIHALVCALNLALGSVGNVLEYTLEPEQERKPHFEAIQELAEDMGEGKVKTLLVLGGNPAYNAPADLSFDELLKEVETSIHLSPYLDETSNLCTWHLPRAHYLESWGDVRAYDGTISPIQPLIEPLYGGKTPIELLALVIDEEPYKGYEIVRKTFAGLLADGDFEKSWAKFLHDGVMIGSAWPTETPKVDTNSLAEAIRKYISSWQPLQKGEFEVVFKEDYSIYDGRFANNGWLQELPDPITKITWDNALLISPTTAKLFGLASSDTARIQVKGRSAVFPVYILPGHSDQTFTLPLGYGRQNAGRIGNGVGSNTYVVRLSDSPFVASSVVLTKNDKKHRLAITQDHHAIDLIGFLERGKRVGNLIREASLEEYQAEPTFAKGKGGEHNEHGAIIKEYEYTGYKWGMVIDLSVCTGCSACVVACQAENNVPIVGRSQVARGREMHWIRVDRYFAGSLESPSMRFQPLTCHHCENAPCEQVCPVAATLHSKEGLNEMVYNRCIGTRYCSNNCPYKVRRFNYLNYHKNMPEILELLMNPEVTVRSRGVMEKCSFCIQRIQSAKIRAKNEDRLVQDGEIVPACAQTCPTEAIVFGDLNDEQSKVKKLAESNRSYQILSELNVKPRTTYLAKITNPKKTLA